MILDLKSTSYMNPEAIKPVLAKATGFVLYHGTSSFFQASILEDGLTCRGTNGNSVYRGRDDRALESNPKLVYLGSFGNANVLGQQSVQKFGGELQIYRVIVPLTELLPDEDSQKQTALESLLFDASCATRGKISLNFVLGYYMKHKKSKKFSLRELFPFFLETSPYDYYQLREEPKIDMVIDSIGLLKKKRLFQHNKI